jgi:hypothetical protein
MGYGDMGGGPPPISWEQPYSEPPVAPPPPAHQFEQYSGITGQTPQEVSAAAAVAQQQEATFSDPRRDYGLPAQNTAHNTGEPSTAPAESFQLSVESFPQLYGGSEGVVDSMRAGGATDVEITTELNRLLRYQKGLMGLL